MLSTIFNFFAGDGNSLQSYMPIYAKLVNRNIVYLNMVRRNFIGEITFESLNFIFLTFYTFNLENRSLLPLNN